MRRVLTYRVSYRLHGDDPSPVAGADPDYFFAGRGSVYSEAFSEWLLGNPNAVIEQSRKGDIVDYDALPHTEIFARAHEILCERKEVRERRSRQESSGGGSWPSDGRREAFDAVSASPYQDRRDDSWARRRR